MQGRARATSIRIRRVETADIEAVRAVLVAAWHHTYDEILGAARVTEITDDWHSLARLRVEVERPAHAFLLAEMDGEVIATGSANRPDDVIAIHRLYVHPDRQGQGIGTALLDALVGRFDPDAAVVLRVEVANARAIAFYERRRFVLGERDEDDWIMRRPARSRVESDRGHSAR